MNVAASTMRRSELVGLGFALFSALEAALVPAFGKLTSARAAPLFIAAATSVCAAVAGVVVLAVRGELSILVERRVGVRLFAIGALGTAAAFFLLFEGMRRATAIEATLCLQIEPAYALVVAWVFLGHRPTRRRLAAIVVLLTGIALAIQPGALSSAAGIVLLLLTPLCWQASHVIVLRGLRGIRPSVLTAARYVYGGALLALYWAARGGRPELVAPGGAGALAALLVFQGVVLCYVGTIVWYQAIARLDLARTTAIVVPLVPVLSFGASYALLGEVATVRQWFGVALTIAGVLAFATAPDARSETERIPTATAPLAPVRAVDLQSALD